MSSVNIQLEYSDTNANVSSLFELLPSTLNLNLSQLNNLSTYVEVANRYANAITIIESDDKIFQAINYDSDDNNNYWIILSKEFTFIDIAIPLVADFKNDQLFDGLSDKDIEMLESLKTFYNN